MVATSADLVSNDILLDHTTTIDENVKEYNEEGLEEELTSVVAILTFQVIIASYSLGFSSMASLIDWFSNDISHLTAIEVIKSYTEALEEVSTSHACNVAISYNEALEGE